MKSCQLSNSYQNSQLTMRLPKIYHEFQKRNSTILDDESRKCKMREDRHLTSILPSSGLICRSSSGSIDSSPSTIYRRSDLSNEIQANNNDKKNKNDFRQKLLLVMKESEKILSLASMNEEENFRWNSVFNYRPTSNLHASELKDQVSHYEKNRLTSLQSSEDLMSRRLFLATIESTSNLNVDESIEVEVSTNLTSIHSDISSIVDDQPIPKPETTCTDYLCPISVNCDDKQDNDNLYHSSVNIPSTILITDPAGNSRLFDPDQDMAQIQPMRENLIDENDLLNMNNLTPNTAFDYQTISSTEEIVHTSSTVIDHEKHTLDSIHEEDEEDEELASLTNEDNDSFSDELPHFNILRHSQQTEIPRVENFNSNRAAVLRRWNGCMFYPVDRYFSSS